MRKRADLFTYHVTDPAFWKLVQKHRTLYTSALLHLGLNDLRLYRTQEGCIRYERDIVLAGSEIISLETISNGSPSMARIRFCNVRQPLDVVVIKIQTDEEKRIAALSTCLYTCIYDAMRGSKQVQAYLVYNWKRHPEVLEIDIHEREDVRKDEKTRRTETLHLGYALQLIEHNAIPQIMRQSGGSGRARPHIILPTVPTSATPTAQDATKMWVLPPEIRPAHLLKAIKQLMRFAKFAVQFQKSHS